MIERISVFKQYIVLVVFPIMNNPTVVKDYTVKVAIAAVVKSAGSVPHKWARRLMDLCDPAEVKLLLRILINRIPIILEFVTAGKTISNNSK
jgi:hypothetical protein